MKAAPGLPTNYLGDFMRAAAPAAARRTVAAVAPAAAISNTSQHGRGTGRGKSRRRGVGRHPAASTRCLHNCNQLLNSVITISAGIPGPTDEGKLAVRPATTALPCLQRRDGKGTYDVAFLRSWAVSCSAPAAASSAKHLAAVMAAVMAAVHEVLGADADARQPLIEAGLDSLGDRPTAPALIAPRPYHATRFVSARPGR